MICQYEIGYSISIRYRKKLIHILRLDNVDYEVKLHMEKEIYTTIL